MTDSQATLNNQVCKQIWMNIGSLWWQNFQCLDVDGRCLPSHSLSLTAQGQKAAWKRDNSLKKKGKDMHRNKTKKKVDLFSTVHQKADIQPLPGKESLNTRSSHSVRQMPSTWMLLHPPSFSQVLLLRMTVCGMNTPLISLNWLSGCVSSQLLVHAHTIFGGQEMGEVALTLQALIRKSQNTGMLSTQSSHTYKIQHTVWECYEEN